MHSDGYLQLKDRSKDIIISGGENISSIEVEDALYKHPAVASCGVVARPDEKWGETPVAYVELKPGSAATEDEIIEHCRKLLARFKCPKAVIFAEIPKTSTGKIQKFRLREMARRTQLSAGLHRPRNAPACATRATCLTCSARRQCADICRSKTRYRERSDRGCTGAMLGPAETEPNTFGAGKCRASCTQLLHTRHHLRARRDGARAVHVDTRRITRRCRCTRIHWRRAG